MRTLVSACLNSGFPMCLFWGKDYVQIYNDGFAPILGRRHPSALGEPAQATWSEIWEFVEPRFRLVRESGQAVGAENQRLLMERNAYAEETFFTFSYSPIRESDAEVRGILCVVTETTGAVLAERRMRVLRTLAAEAAKVRSVDQASDCIARALTEPNPDLPFALVYALDEASVLRVAVAAGMAEPGHGFPVSLPPGPADDPRSLAAAWREASVSGQAVRIEDPSGEWGIPALPGSEPARSALVIPLTGGEGGTQVGFAVLGINPHRALDTEYRGFLDLVAGHVATARQNATAFEAERRRAEALAELDRAKSAFFSNVSHEFRTPLTLLLGPVEQALAADPGEALAGQREGLEMARRNALRLLKLVNVLLDFSRLEAGRTPVARVPTDVGAFTAGLAGMFRSLCETAGLRLEVDSPASASLRPIDRDHWEKIVLNLLSNAYKFTFAGGIRVRYREDAEALVLEIEDTGTGIAPAELPRLFERFHRIEGSRSRTYEGSGIGLALVRDLARLHGGEVEVRSEPGRGSTFSVRIPAAEADPAGPVPRGADQDAGTTPSRAAEQYLQEALHWGPRAGKEAGSAPDGRANILLVEDNADMREYLAGLLRERWAVETASEGAEALRLARSRPPDLVLSDIMMPGLDGLGFLKELRADPALGGVPVILISARAGREAALDALGLGADDYLVKPFSAQDVVARVESRLGLARARAQSTQDLLESREQVLQSQKFEVIGKLAGGIAHDFNNLLTGINGFAELGLGAVPPDSPVRTFFEEILKAGRRAAALTGQLLAYGRRQIVAPRTLDLRAIVQDMGNLLRRCVPASISIVQAAGEGHSLILCDKTQLEQAIMNLATNAADAMPEGGTLALSIQEADLDERQAGFQLRASPGRYVMLSVEDSGRGMGPEIMAHLFEPFYTTKEKGKGSGLGLATVYAVVKQNKGAIKVASRPREGTVFQLYLPRAEAAEPAADPARRPSGREGRGGIILLAEDEPTVRSYAAACLRKAGYRVWEASDGGEAVQRYAQAVGKVDLLLTDVVMPRMGGRELAEWFLSLRPDGRVVFMSGYTEDAELRKGILEARSHFLAKPFGAQDLEEKLAEVLAPAPAQQKA